MRKLRDAIIELYREASTSLPEDVEESLRLAAQREKRGSSGRSSLSVILENVKRARETGRPICQDTGMPVFFAKIPPDVSYYFVKQEIVKATRLATKRIPLRPNAVDVLTDLNSGDNTGINFPIIYFEETKGRRVVMDLMLKGGGSENIGQLYKLPVAELKAERDMEGVRKCVLDAVYRAQGKGCPPYVVGVGIGASKDQVTRLSKEQLLRHVDDSNDNENLSRLEKRILRDVNRLRVGPLGLGGRTTALAVKIGVSHRHPASYFVDVTFMCWTDRRARLIYDIGGGKFEIRN
ncbi:MAG: fumarate hydratase [Nitrospirota bacterium]